MNIQIAVENSLLQDSFVSLYMTLQLGEFVVRWLYLRLFTDKSALHQMYHSHYRVATLFHVIRYTDRHCIYLKIIAF